MAEQIFLAERMDTAYATALAAELQEKSSEPHIVLNGRAVAHFGAQAAQVIISAAKTVHASGGRLEFTEISDRAADQLKVIGLTVSDLTEVSE